MSTFTELIGSHGLRETLGVSGIPAPTFISIARALKCVLAADGEVHGAELNAYLETCRRFGATDDMLDELRQFNPAGTTVEMCFGGMDPDSIPARTLLYEAIRIAKADGTYADEERAAVKRAANLLGIDEDWLTNITALADAEQALRNLRISMLVPPGLRQYVEQ
jgi:uncharacterized tellurite resistance protein B-like protein